MTSPSFASGAYAATGLLTKVAKPMAAAAMPALAGSMGGAAGAGSGVSFGDTLKGALSSIQETGRATEAQASAAIRGKGDLVDVVTAVAESEAAIETLVAVRDKVIAAYEDIMRMPI